MSVGTADLHKAIHSAWDASGLNDKFNSLWPLEDRDDYPVLEEQKATALHPFPYCVYGTDRPRVVSRMSSEGAFKRHINEAVVNLSVHAKRVDGDSRSSKQIAAAMAEEVMKVFGGHPTISPTLPMLDNGGCLLTQYQNDYPDQEEQYEYCWHIQYKFLVDVPMAVGA